MVTLVLNWLNQNSGSVVAVASMLGVLVAAIYAFFTWRLWQATTRQANITHALWSATERQANITQSTFDATNRPYVSVTPKWGNSIVDIDRLCFECVFENYGTLPAVVTRWRLQVCLPDREVATEELSESEMRLCLFPERPYTKAVDFTGDGIWPAPTVHVDATLEYRGATDRVYRTRMMTRIANGRFESPCQEIS